MSGKSSGSLCVRYYRKLRYTFFHSKRFVCLFVLKSLFLLRGREKVWGKIPIVFSFPDISKDYKYTLVVFLLACTDLVPSAPPPPLASCVVTTSFLWPNLCPPDTVWVTWPSLGWPHGGSEDTELSTRDIKQPRGTPRAQLKASVWNRIAATASGWYTEV